MRNKKRIAMLAAALMLAVVPVTGCKKTDSKEGTDSKNPYEASSEDQLAEPKKGDTVATFHIENYGDIVVRMFPEAAPKAVENFITHAKDGYYDGVVFHRVINDFMIQGGDPTATGAGGESIWKSAFEDEFAENLLPIRGALCMANAGADTNGSQFFIVQAKEANVESVTSYLAQSGITLTDAQKKKFDENGGTPHLTYAHTVFGQVIEGMDVVDAIAAARTDSSDRPISDVKITSIDVKEWE